MLFGILFTSIYGGVGLIFLIIGLGMKSYMKKKIARCTAKTWGTIVGFQAFRGKHGLHYRPVLQYEIYGNVIEHLYGSNVNTPKRKALKEGDTVAIMYDPENPDRFLVEGDTEVTTVANVFIGVFFICISIAVAVGIVCARLGLF